MPFSHIHSLRHYAGCDNSDDSDDSNVDGSAGSRDFSDFEGMGSSDWSDFYEDESEDSEEERALEMAARQHVHVDAEHAVQLYFAEPPDDERQFKRKLQKCLRDVREFVEVGQVRKRWQWTHGFADFCLHRPAAFAASHLLERLVAQGFGRVDLARNQGTFFYERPPNEAELAALRARYQDEDVLRYGLRTLPGPPDLPAQTLRAAAACVAPRTVTYSVKYPDPSPLYARPDRGLGYWPARFTADRQHPWDTPEGLRPGAGAYATRCRAVEAHGMLPLKLAAVKRRHPEKKRRSRTGKKLDPGALIARLETELAATPAPAPPVAAQVRALTVGGPAATPGGSGSTAAVPPEAAGPAERTATGALAPSTTAPAAASAAAAAPAPAFFRVVVESLPRSAGEGGSTETVLGLVRPFGDQLSGLVVPDQGYGGPEPGRLLLHAALGCPCLTTLHLSGSGFIDDPPRLWEFSCRRLPLLSDVELPEAFGYDWALATLASHCKLLRRLVVRADPYPRARSPRPINVPGPYGGRAFEDLMAEQAAPKEELGAAGLRAVLAGCEQLRVLQCLNARTPFTEGAVRGITAPLALCRVNAPMSHALRLWLAKACAQLAEMGDGTGMAYSLDGGRDAPAARDLRHYMDQQHRYYGGRGGRETYPLDYALVHPGRLRHAGTGVVVWQGHVEVGRPNARFVRREDAALRFLYVTAAALDRILGPAGGGDLVPLRVLVALQAAHGCGQPLVTDAVPGDGHLPAACLAAGHCIPLTGQSDLFVAAGKGLWVPQGDLSVAVKWLLVALGAGGCGEGAGPPRAQWTITVEGGCRGDGVAEEARARAAIGEVLPPGLDAQFAAAGHDWGDSTTGMKSPCKGWARFVVTGHVAGA